MILAATQISSHGGYAGVRSIAASSFLGALPSFNGRAGAIGNSLLSGTINSKPKGRS